jgi:hypothetical protein
LKITGAKDGAMNSRSLIQQKKLYSFRRKWKEIEKQKTTY